MIGSQRADRPRGGRMTIARSRGAASGLLLVLLGIWGALIPFIGPNFDFAFTPDQPWIWTTGRGWLEVLPGVVTVIGGLLLLTSRNRATAMLGGWLTVAAGAWFVIGRALAGPLGLGDAGAPVAADETKRVWLDLTYFYGLGALIIFLGALALGRVSVRSVRDVEYVNRAAVVDTPAHTGPLPVTHTGPVAAGTPVGDTPTEVIDPQQQPPRRRGLRNLFRGRGDRTLVHR
ncbi:hypothetical protein EV589_4848 [Mycobacterium sp. BK558]|uniref:Uncharacterized protein n=1 Tax=Mycolicibacterium chlorophenolicum TaxID=37916 RepID=A0A0J6W965_9MYCO|nr:hypothetical protein [Mycolicibacterium chlorophenolicum]KMO78182.1 hypothetical protein MCHLDSM_02095 [Mycolicibacterium chlorophenolicum]MBI5337032.1 hypothetical protein [Mycolicibacterium rufum]RZT14130.1 hypothetical protein EV589_4848 [Mycobacterium sp. BK558]